MRWGPDKAKPQAGLTPQTRGLIDEMAKHRGLSVRAKQELDSSLARGDGGWVRALTLGAGASKAAAVGGALGKTSAAAVAVPRVGRRRPLMDLLHLPRSFSGRKPAAAIARDSPPARELFHGGPPGVDREAEKDRLALTMEVGREAAREQQAALSAATAVGASAAAPAGTRALAHTASWERRRRLEVEEQEVDTRETLIDQIVCEIDERRRFMEALRAAGGDAALEPRMRAEIGQRMAHLARLGVPTPGYPIAA